MSRGTRRPSSTISWKVSGSPRARSTTVSKRGPGVLSCSCAFQSPLSGLATSSCVAALARSHCATTLGRDTVGHLAVGIDPNGHEIAAPDLLVHHRPKHRVPLVGLTNFGLRFRFSNHDLTPHLQNYRNHLQNLRLLGAQIVVPIVLQGASGRRLSVLRQRHACGVGGHRPASACLSAYPGTVPACSGCLPAAFGSSVPFRRHDGVRLRVGSHTPGRSSVGMRTIHRQWPFTFFAFFGSNSGSPTLRRTESRHAIGSPPAKLCTTNPSRAVLSSLTASERSAAPCPGPGASTSPLTTSPPRALASSCAEIIACVWFGVASKLSRSGLAISWGSRAVWAAAGLRAFGGIPPVAPSIAAA